MTAQQLADRLERMGLRVEWRGTEYRAQCPYHTTEPGRQKDLNLSFSDGDKELLTRCNSHQCEYQQIISAVEQATGKVNGAAPKRDWDPDWVQKGHTAYRYDDEKGQRSYRTVRKPDKTFYQQHWDANASTYRKGRAGTPSLPYRLPRWYHEPSTRILFWVEGEKDVHTIESLGEMGTTSAGGSGGYDDDVGAWFTGRRVCILPDNDKPGSKYAETVLESLRRHEAEAVIARLPVEADTEDVTDWTRRYGGTREKLLALAAAAFGGPTLTEEEWDQPLPLGEFKPPPFPIAILPTWVRDMAEAVALCLSVPQDAAAMFMLSCLAAACQKRVEAHIRRGWIEPLSLWVLIVMEPANRKSPLFRQLLAPIVRYQTELRELSKSERASAAASHRILEGRLKKAEQAAVKATKEFQQEQAEREARELAEKLEQMVVPAEPRLLVNDATPERLGMLLNENSGRMAVMSPEGDVFEMMAGRYSNGQANLGLYLAGHSGDDWTVDRVGRAGVDLIRTAITFGLTVQPDVLAGFAAKPQFRGRGLLGRFLYCVPETLLGSRPAVTPSVLEQIEAEYAKKLTALLSISVDRDESGSPCPNALLFDEGASEAMAGIQDWIEPLLAPWGELRPMADWAGKLAGTCARITSLLHLAELAGTPRPWSIPVEAESVNAVRGLGDYMIAHAKNAFNVMGADEATEGARHILSWLKAHPVGRFTRRNLHRRLIRTFPAVDRLDAALSVLIERGYIRQVMPEVSTRPGPKPLAFAVHPDLAGGGGELEAR